MQFEHNQNKPNDPLEDNDLITNSHVSDALRYSFFDRGTVSAPLLDSLTLLNFLTRARNHHRRIWNNDYLFFLQLQVKPDGLTKLPSLSKNLPLKTKQKVTKELSSLSTFASLICEKVDPVIKTDQCAHYIFDNGIGANTPQKMIINLRAVYQCLRKAGLKLSMWFSGEEVDLLGRPINTRGLEQLKQKIVKFLEKCPCPTIQSALQPYISFSKYHLNYSPRLLERVTPFFQLPGTNDAKDKILISPKEMNF